MRISFIDQAEVIIHAKTQFISSLIESCEVQDHHDRFRSTSGVTQNMPFWGIPFTVLKTHIYIGLF